MVRTTVGTIAEAELSVQESESVIQIAADQTATLSSSSSQTTTIKAPSGTVIRILAVRFVAPPPSAATSGNHTLRILGAGTKTRYLVAQSDSNTQIILNDRIVSKANSAAEPSTEAAQATTLGAIRADDTVGVQFKYINGTDASQTQTRDIDIIALERGVSS